MPNESPTDAPLRSVYADDAEFGELIGLFVDELPERVAAIRESLATPDLDQLKIVAHQLMGAGGGYGFLEITDAGRTLETLVDEAMASEDADFDAMRTAADELIALCGRAVAD